MGDWTVEGGDCVRVLSVSQFWALPEMSCLMFYPSRLLGAQGRNCLNGTHAQPFPGVVAKIQQETEKLDALNLQLLQFYLDAKTCTGAAAQDKKDHLLRFAQDELGRNHHRTRRLKKQLDRVLPDGSG